MRLVRLPGDTEENHEYCCYNSLFGEFLCRISSNQLEGCM